MTSTSNPRELARRRTFEKEYGGGHIKPLTWRQWFGSLWYWTADPLIRLARRLWWKATGQDKDPDLTEKVQGHLWRGEHEVRKGRQVHVELDTLQSDIARTQAKRKR